MCGQPVKNERRSKIDHLIAVMERLADAVEMSNHHHWAAQQNRQHTYVSTGTGGSGVYAYQQEQPQAQAAAEPHQAPGTNISAAYNRLLRNL